MAKILGIQKFEYHIEAEGTRPARDFVGYKVHICSRLKPSAGWGMVSDYYPVRAEEFPYVFDGYTEKDIPFMVGQDVTAEIATTSSNKRELTFVEFHSPLQTKAVAK